MYQLVVMTHSQLTNSLSLHHHNFIANYRSFSSQSQILLIPSSSFAKPKFKPKPFLRFTRRIYEPVQPRFIVANVHQPEPDRLPPLNAQKVIAFLGGIHFIKIDFFYLFGCVLLVLRIEFSDFINSLMIK